jgi:hypothetical protein
MSKQYTKNTWLDEVLAGSETFNLKQGASTLFSGVTFELATAVTTAGSAVNASRMNNIEDGVDDLDTRLNTMATQTKTISSGAITLDTITTKVTKVTVANEGTVAYDTLSTITGGDDGDILILVGTSGDVTTLDTSGNIEQPCVVLSNAPATLMKNGSNWEVVSFTAKWDSKNIPLTAWRPRDTNGASEVAELSDFRLARSFDDTMVQYADLCWSFPLGFQGHWKWRYKYVVATTSTNTTAFKIIHREAGDGEALSTAVYGLGVTDDPDGTAYHELTSDWSWYRTATQGKHNWFSLYRNVSEDSFVGDVHVMEVEIAFVTLAGMGAL